MPGSADLADDAGGTVPDEADSEAARGIDLESALLEGLSTALTDSGEGLDDRDTFAGPEPENSSSDDGAVPVKSVPEAVAELENTLVEGLSDGATVSTAPDDPSARADGAIGDTAGDVADALLESLSESPRISFDEAAAAGPPSVSGSRAVLPEIAPGPDMRRTGAGPAAALAFAADPETENALRQGLLDFEGPTPDCEDAQVWPGGLRAAVAALAQGHSTQLVIVDIDGIPFPAGAVHELAEVCEIGTVVIAIGSDGTARANRELLLAGVSDYLVKPIAAASVRQAATFATASDRNAAGAGHVAGFAGTGGSGASTVAAATALHAAAQGRYVSVLDLNRTVSASALLLDVEPAAGLDQLFDMVGKMSPDPQMLDGAHARRSDRISLYAFRLGVSPPPVPPMPVLNWLLDQLRQRFQLVIVDGLDDPKMHFSLLAEVDVCVLVAEPTVAGAARAARILDLLGGGTTPLLVQNHTREFKPDEGTRLLMNAGIETPPDVVIPFEATLPEIADRGWPRDRLPRSLRQPVAGLGDRIVARAMAGRPAMAGLSRET